MSQYPQFPASEPPVHLAHVPPAIAEARPALLHSGVTTRRYFLMHLAALAVPAIAGVLLNGWRALALMALVGGSAVLATRVWRKIGKRGAQLSYAHVLWLSALLALMLPAHLASRQIPDGPANLWLVAIGAGVLLVIFTWLLGGLASSRIHPAVVTYLALVVLFAPALVPYRVLHRGHLLVGDLLDAPVGDLEQVPAEPWYRSSPQPDERQAVFSMPPGKRLSDFTSAQDKPLRAWLTMESLLRDRLPPLQDLMLAGQPAPIGWGSGLAVIAGGLILLYRGLIDFRIPLLALLAAYVAMLILPVPVVITENATLWRWIVAREHGVGWAAALTFANYEIFAGPLLFISFFIATAPALRPISRRGRVLYALLLGLSAALLQLYASVPHGPYAAVLIASLFTPTLDKAFRPRTLV